LWTMALGLAICNIAGALLGARLAIHHGSNFVRWVFLLVATALILKFGYDTFA